MSIRYEPQAVTAARYILNDQAPPPEEVYLEDVQRFPHRFEGFSSAVKNHERVHDIVSPDLSCDDFNRVMIALEKPCTLRLHAIDDAMREVFKVMRLLETGSPGRDLDLVSLNLSNGLMGACLDELEALLEEWNELVTDTNN